MKEIARLTGFSPTTVSLVLNGRSRRFNISRRTQDLIRSVAEQNNYHPNVHARSLRSRITNIVGLTVPTLDNPFFGEMAETFEGLARSARKLPLITVTHYDPREELAVIHYFLSQKVDCVFTANLTALDEVSELCSRAGIRQIVLDSQESAKPTVATANVEAARALTRNLLAAMRSTGRAGPAYFVGGMPSHAISMQRLEGFRSALREAGLPFDDGQFIPTAFDAELACGRLRELVAGREVGGLFLNAVPALEGLVRLFPEMPGRCRKIPCAVFDYHPFMSLLAHLRLLIVRQNPRQMMTRAYEIFANPRQADRKLHVIPYELLLPPGAVAAAASRRSRRPARAGLTPAARPTPRAATGSRRR